MLELKLLVVGFVVGVGFGAAAVWLTDRTPSVGTFAEGAQLYQESAILDEWHHVATIHGWVDDLDVCRDLGEYLEQTGSSRYACRPIVVND